MQPMWIVVGFVAIIALSLVVAPRRATVEGFFRGSNATGGAPMLWTLVLSQVTTWIFARSLMNAAILGYFYGIAGTLAYAAYYGSFLTGCYVIMRLRDTDAMSVQDWLSARFGATGTVAYNVVIGLRLLSEVFANLIVVGLIFGAVLPETNGIAALAVVLVAVIGLAYSAWGGLSAALRTDVAQMVVFLVVFGLAFGALILSPDFDLGAVLTAEGTSGAYNGWVLLVVAALQVFSYPVHDPVMMDRGFLADKSTTRTSFIHAFWISAVLIIAFGMFGIQAALVGADYEGQLIGTWSTMFPNWIFAALMLSLLVSAVSTLDSALSSAARLCVEEFKILPRTLTGGRVAMVVFMAAGTGLTLWGNQSLFDAVAVSGTASMFLTPVLIGGLVMGRQIPIWSFMVAYGAAIIGAAMYFARGADWAAALLPEGHKYEQLLVICIVVLVVGGVAVAAGARKSDA